MEKEVIKEVEVVKEVQVVKEVKVKDPADAEEIERLSRELKFLENTITQGKKQLQ